MAAYNYLSRRGRRFGVEDLRESFEERSADSTLCVFGRVFDGRGDAVPRKLERGWIKRLIGMSRTYFWHKEGDFAMECWDELY